MLKMGRHLALGVVLCFLFLSRLFVGQDVPAGADAAAKQKAAELFEQAAKLYTASQYAKAAEELIQSLRLDPQQARANKVLGVCYQLLGKLKQAEAGFATAAKLDGDDAETWFFLGRVYYMEHSFDNARNALQTSARLNSGDPQVHELLALTLVAIGDPEGALAEFTEGVLSNSKMPKPLWTPHLSYGVFLHQMNRTKESEEQLLIATKLNPKDWMAHFELGKLWFDLDRFDAAVDELTAASRTAKPGSEESSRVYRLLSRTYFRLGREDEARSAIAKAGK
jgi:Flp pilus assembly protein TadD